MKRLFLILLAIVFAAPSFSKTKKVVKKHASKSAIQSVTMRRTACFGKCPDYSIEMRADGSTTYTGMRFVKDSGTFTKNIGSANTMKIINMLMQNRADTCKNAYENRIPDLPGLMYTIKYADSTKTIYSANWGPQYLKQIADEMDRSGRKVGKGWKKIK